MAAVLRGAVEPRHFGLIVPMAGVVATGEEFFDLTEVVDARGAAGPVIPGAGRHRGTRLEQPAVVAAHATPRPTVERNAHHDLVRVHSGIEPGLY